MAVVFETLVGRSEIIDRCFSSPVSMNEALPKIIQNGEATVEMTITDY